MHAETLIVCIYIRAVCVVTFVAIVDIVSAIVIYSLVAFDYTFGCCRSSGSERKKKKKDDSASIISGFIVFHREW